MNKLLKHLLQTKQIYCHVIELATADELTDFLDNAWEGFTAEGWDEKTVFEFLSTIEVMYYTSGEDDEDDEDELFNVDLSAYLTENYINC